MKRNIDYSKNCSVLNKYLHYVLNVKNFSSLTAYEYCLDLNNFFSFIRKYKEIEVEERDFTVFIVANIKKEDIIAYLIYLNAEKHLTSTTRNRRLASIKSFYNWLSKYSHYKNVIEHNPSQNIEKPAKVQKNPKHLNKLECNKVLGIFSKENSRNYLRDNTIIALFLHTGIRLSELTNMNIEDCNLINQQAIVKRQRQQRKKNLF